VPLVVLYHPDVIHLQQSCHLLDVPGTWCRQCRLFPRLVDFFS
jgi:hypothetical protein